MKQYKLDLMKEAEETGVPPMRSLMLEYPEDETAKKVTDQFMLGSNLLMAPIFDAKAE